MSVHTSRTEHVVNHQGIHGAKFVCAIVQHSSLATSLFVFVNQNLFYTAKFAIAHVIHM